MGGIGIGITPVLGGVNPYLPYYSSVFDEGSAITVAPDGGNVRITPEKTWNGTTWAWYAVRYNNLAGKTPSFVIAKSGHYWLDSTDEMIAYWATNPDTDVWTKMDNWAIGASDISFNKVTPFPGGMIYIAHHPMYPFSRITRKVGEWAANAYVGETPSTTGKIIGYATARAQGFDGRTVPALPFYGFKVSKTSSNYKLKMVLSAYNHPSEVTGPFELEGAMSWLLGGSDEAEFLLNYFDIYVYPCLNPQGVWGGYTRSCPQNNTLDHNRQWLTSGVLECIDAFKTAITNDIKDQAEVSLDYHEWGDNWQNKLYCYDTAYDLIPTFVANMVQFQPLFASVADAAVNTRFDVWVKDYIGTRLNGAFEAGVDQDYTLADWKVYGQNSMKVIEKMLASGYFTQVVGSRSFNGTTDRMDWANVANLKGSPLTISAWVWMNATGSNRYILCQHDAGDTQTGIVFNVNSIYFNFIRCGPGGSVYSWRDDGGTFVAGAWFHLLATNNGGMAAGDTTIYINGISKAITYTAGVGAETEHTGKWSIGGRIFDDTRCWNGKLAQIAVWNRVLSAGEIADMAAGKPPDIYPTGIQFYFKGNSNSLFSRGKTAVLDGSTYVSGAGNGPPMVYPGAITVGSRSFNGTTDRIDWAAITNLQDHALSISLWCKSTVVPPSGNGYFICMHTPGDANYALVISYTTNRVTWVVGRATTGALYYCDGSPGSDIFNTVGEGWVHVLVTWNGSLGVGNAHLYKNGVEKTPNYSAGAGATNSAAGSWSTMGRIWDDTRNGIGNIGQIGVWDRVLNATEIANLAKGKLPSTAAPSGLVFYYKGTTSDLHDEITTTLGVADGTTQQTGAGDGPPMIG